MDKSYLKTIALVVVVMVVATTVPVLTPQTQAQSAMEIINIVGLAGAAFVGCMAWATLSDIFGSILTSITGLVSAGLDVPTDDNKHQAENMRDHCFNFVKNYIVEKVKRRLINDLTNEVVRWVRGEGEPRFISDPLGFLNNSADSAMGDTLQEVGLADNLCSADWEIELPLRIEQARARRTSSFDQRSSCTLSEFIGNVDGGVSITDYSGNWDQGGWGAFNQLYSKMQNNEIGVRMLVDGLAAGNVAEQASQAELNAQIGDGFIGDRICRVWQELGTDNYESGPDTWRETPDGVKYVGKDDHPDGSNWRCIQPETATPGQSMSNQVGKMLGSEVDRIVNADELISVLMAFLESLVGRITGGEDTDADTPLLEQNQDFEETSEPTDDTNSTDDFIDGTGDEDEIELDDGTDDGTTDDGGLEPPPEPPSL